MEKTSVNSDYDLILKGQVKLDSTTFLENFFWTSIWVSPFLFIFGIILLMATGSGWFFPAILLGLFGFIPSIIFYYLTDNYYILDCDKKVLKYRFKFAFYEKLSIIAEFADFHAVTLQTSVTKSSGNSDYSRGRETYRQYQILAVLASGKVLALSDLTFKVLEKEEKLAKRIAQTTGAKYVPAPSSRSSSPAVAKDHEGRYTFSHMNNDLSININIRKSTLNLLWAFLFAFSIIFPAILSHMGLI